MLTLFLALSACIDYNVAGLQRPDDTLPIVVPVETTANAAMDAILVPIEDPPEEVVPEEEDCSARAVGDPDNDRYVNVAAWPQITQRSARTAEVRQGEDVDLDFSVLSQCGPIDMNMYLLDVLGSEGSDSWIIAINDAAVPASLEDTTNGFVFPPYAANNLDHAETVGRELFYGWHDEAADGPGRGALIATEELAASEVRDYRFTWTGTSGVPVGETFRVRFIQQSWTEVPTPEFIDGVAVLPYAEGQIEVEVTIIP